MVYKCYLGLLELINSTRPRSEKEDCHIDKVIAGLNREKALLKHFSRKKSRLSITT
jgi:hypothetical protein